LQKVLGGRWKVSEIKMGKKSDAGGGAIYDLGEGRIKGVQ